eukprot:1361541-Amorphochlora_amoeboformis.AAC.2
MAGSTTGMRISMYPSAYRFRCDLSSSDRHVYPADHRSVAHLQEYPTAAGCPFSSAWVQAWSMSSDGVDLDRLAAEMLIAEAERAHEFAKTGGALGYMEYMKRRKPSARFAGAVVSSVVRSNKIIRQKEIKAREFDSDDEGSIELCVLDFAIELPNARR